MEVIGEVKGNGQPFDPVGGITIAGYYYFLSGGPDRFELYRHELGNAHDLGGPSIMSFGPNYDPMEVLILILTDRRQIAMKSQIQSSFRAF